MSDGKITIPYADPGIVFIVVVVLITAFVGWQVITHAAADDELEDAEWAQEPEPTSITYYVENETTIHGPRNLTIDGQEIHVRFEPCSNYTYVNDEPHPCR